MRECGVDDVNSKVLEAISHFNLLRKEERVLVCVSGGMDSVSLLHFLCCLDWQLNIWCCHVNHGIRGKEANRDEEFVIGLCKQLGVDLFVRRIDVPQTAKTQKLSLEEAARNERYRIFEEIANELNSKIATAHTLSDSAETLILNMSRGTGLAGLCGVPAARGRVIRPLILVSKTEIAGYVKQHKLAYVTDSTNSDITFTRNFIRHRIIPELYKLNGSFDTVFRRMYQNLWEDETFIAKCVDEALAQPHILVSEGRYNVARLKLMSHSVIFRVIKRLLMSAGVLCDEKKARLIQQMIRLGKGRLMVKEHIFVSVCGAFLTVEKEAPKEAFPKIYPREIDVSGPGRYKIHDQKGLELRLVTTKDPKSHSSLNDASQILDYDKIVGQLKLRTRQAGDKIKLPRYGCTKTLKKLFSEHKIPQEQKDKCLLLADECGVIWLENFGCDCRVVPDNHTKKYCRCSCFPFESIGAQKRDKPERNDSLRCE
ncbi:MAG: tRNA lysidine(34) synthetase TilS [Oscillospiraceae bacterium]|jgi:tRNA(Ile)-lysidine synthase|nr:tRNA lysidine(34) synthetase TilS [Oscillospiraceae bacterium]